MNSSSIEQLKNIETQGREATEERLNRLENKVKLLQKLITDMEIVLMEATEHFETKTDLSSITTNTHFFK